MTSAPELVPDTHFLSVHNPLATAEQRDIEATAIRLLGHPAVERGREQVAGRWKTIVGRDVSAQAWSRFDELVEEFTFNYVLKAVNGDPHHPKVSGMNYCPPHEWFDMSVPGSRASGGDGPDQHYVLIPVQHGDRYEITGRRFDPVPADIPLAVAGNPSLTMTVGSLDLRGIDVADDGTYTITVGPEDGGRNHVRTAPGSMYLFIRECRSDWRQVPSALRVRRLDPPRCDPWTDDQIATRAAQMMAEDVPMMHWWMAILAAAEANTVPPPFGTGGVGGLITQQVCFPRLELADDEAFVFTFGSGGAAYRNLTLYDYWFRTIEYPSRTSSFTNAQTVQNADGGTTYVVAHEDPGVHNWLDTAGLRELLLVHRWQGMSGNAAPPTATGRLLKFRDLDGALPGDIARVDAAQRAEQLSDRLATFQLRFRTD